MQEANVSIPQFHRVWNHLVGTENGRITCFGLMGWGDRIVTFIEQYHITKNQAHSRKLSARSRKGSHIQTQTIGKPRRRWIVACGPFCHKRTLFSIRSSVVHFLKTTKLWSRWSLRAEVQQWDTCPEPTESRSIGCLTESIWTPRSKSNMLTPKTNSLTCWPQEISHVMNGPQKC